MKAALKYVGKSRYTLEDLKEIITILRAPDGCPWDREQDHKSIRRDFLEECYEAIEAIDTEDPRAAARGAWGCAFSGGVPQ